MVQQDPFFDLGLLEGTDFGDRTIFESFLPTNSIGYRRSGGNYTGEQMTQRQNISYIGRNNTRGEGTMQLFDAAAIQAFFAGRPVCSRIAVRQSGQYTSSAGTEIMDLQWHGQDPLPTDQNNGWVAPFGPTRNFQMVKVQIGSRREMEFLNPDAQTIADGFISGAYKGCSLLQIANNLNDWGWCVGWTNRSTSENAGVPNGFTPVDAGNRIELIITAAGS